MPNNFLSELGRRAPQIALAMLAARQGGPQALAAFQSGMMQRQQAEEARTRQAQMDEERRAQQEAQEARLRNADERAEEDQRMQRLQAALSYLDTYGKQQAETATDPVAAENAMLGRATSLESMFNVPSGQLAGAVPNLTPAISARKKRTAQEIYERAEKVYGPEAMATDNITLQTEPFGDIKPSALRALFMPPAVTQTGTPALPMVGKPDVPNTPEEQFYQQYASERGKKSFVELPTSEQAKARKQWMQADDRPLVVNTGAADVRTNARIDRIVASFNSHPIVKEYNETQAQQGIIRNIVAGQWSGPGDMAAVFAFMKALDPNSVVRETEYANAARSGNIFAGWAARFNGALSPNGGFLSERVRQDFLRTINARMDVKGRQYSNLRKQLVGRIDRIKAGAPETGDEALVEYSTGAAPDDGATSSAAPPLTKDAQVGQVYTLNGKKVRVREKTRSGFLYDEVPE